MVDTEASSTYDGVADRPEVLQLLADPTCRAILLVLTDESHTAAEVAERLGLPLSTVYRKLDALLDTPLVESTLRLRTDGHHPREFRSSFRHITVRLARQHDRALSVRVS